MVMSAALTMLALCQDPVSASTQRVERFASPPPLWSACETAAADGLRWLAAAQTDGGYWQGHVGHKRQDDYMILRDAAFNQSVGEGHIGVSAICGLAFLAGGHMPDRGDYGPSVRRLLDYVCAHVADNGMISDGGTRMYSHAFATLFLAEVYGMSGDESTRAKLERAVNLVVDCQNAQGGWRYNAFTEEADVSVTVCQVQALRAARNIGIEVPARTIADAVAFIQRARTNSGRDVGLFYYKNEGRGARTKNREYAINAAAVTALFAAGVHDERLFAPTLDFLDRAYPDIDDYYGSHFYYWYGNYYACQAFFQAGGQRYEQFHDRLCHDILRKQESDGRWLNTTGPGDEFATAIACIVLQVRKQFLPIFQR